MDGQRAARTEVPAPRAPQPPAWTLRSPDPERPAAWRIARSAVRALAVASSPLRTLPGYLLIGTKRGGTTTLQYALLDHPQVSPLFPPARFTPARADRKGLRYFDTGHRHHGLAWYRSHFPTRPATTLRRLAAGRAVSGDASPYYLYAPGAAGRAATVVPGAHILVLLREPGARAFSHWKEQVRRGQEPLSSFEDALDAEAARLAMADHAVSSLEHEHHGYLEQGDYEPHLRSWFEHFGRDRVLVLFSEDLFAEPQAAFDRTCRHLGLDPHPIAAWPARNRTDEATLPPQVRKRLDHHFAEPNRRLAELLGRPLPWGSEGRAG